MSEPAETLAAARDEADMEAAGRRLGESLRPGDLVALDGPLGAGKTCFVRGAVAGLEAGETVTSPTFTLVQEYRSGRIPAYHFDFYRLEEAAEVLRLGWDDYLAEEAVVLVEWAGKFPELLPAGAIRLRLSLSGDGARLVERLPSP